MKVICNKANPPLGGLLAVELYRSCGKNVEVSWGDESTVTLPKAAKPEPYRTSNDLIRILENAFNKSADPLQRVTMNHWLSFSLILDDEIPKSLEYLNKTLGPLTYLVGESLTVSDLSVFAVLHASSKFKDATKTSTLNNIQRWMKLIQAQPAITQALNQLPADVIETLSKSSISRRSPSVNKEAGRQQEGKFIELPHAEMGKVVVRFPPEASGYLHIGHAKAALLNQYYQEAFEGKLIMRFDDTNPAKENAEFEKVILEDVEMLEIKPDMFTHTSQYFDLMLQCCERLLREGKAFVDDTPADQMKAEREQKIDSKNKTNSVERNLQLWQEMQRATALGVQCCVRAKIDMQSANGCLRDPTIYRCKPEPHPRTGTKYNVYPTYDFACPIVDSVEGVTHVLRTMEYHDRDPQFYWFIDALGLRKPYIWEYSRLSMTNTVLSKRKLTWFVAEGLVDGWDDPRMPTVRGVLRRGLTVEALRRFIQAQGSSRSVVFMEWDKIWAINKKVIDPYAPRYTALEADAVPVHLQGPGADGLAGAQLHVPLHPKRPDDGLKRVPLAPRLLLDRADAAALVEGQDATFINYGNVTINRIHRAADGTVTSVDGTPNLANEDYKKTPKLTWLADDDREPHVEAYCVYFDHIISKPLLGKDEDFKQYVGHATRWEVPMIGEPALADVKVGDIIQLQRRGFFRVDAAPPARAPRSPQTGARAPLVLFHVPDGHTKAAPGQPKPVQAKQHAVDASGDATRAASLSAQVAEQGELVRALKAAKAAKPEVDAAVKTLLDLKAQYKSATGQEWKPGAAVAGADGAGGAAAAAALEPQVARQGELVRALKAAKADKPKVDEAVKLLLDLKAKYKEAAGKEWKPGASLAPAQVAGARSGADADGISTLIAAQGEKVRKLKSEKADKATVDAEVKTLLSLKAKYKSVTGSDWAPNAPSAASQHKTMKSEPTPATMNGDGALLAAGVSRQGDVVRELKANKADKATIDAEVKKLLELKAAYLAATGVAYAPPAPTADKPKQAKPKPKAKPKEAKKEPSPKPTKEESSSGLKKVTRLGLEASKETDLPEWYSQVITKSEMIDYYDISGCYILRPWSYSIWDRIRAFLSGHFRDLGVKDGYFPIFVSKAALEREKSHIADFSPEVAWVTHSGSSELAEHIAVRPTSETVMYPAYAKWIQSHRDLPLKLNQWNNVVRWEFKQPQPFLRTREFLWQEGHTAFRFEPEAAEEVLQVLDLYARVYEELLAIPVIKGRKTEKEKFAGGVYTTTVEAYVPASGRAIQGATSHHLGQNFSRMFEVVYDDPDTHEKAYVYQNSWGLTTRTIGVMVLVHGDDRGLVLPPRVADVQVVVVPCGVTASNSPEERQALLDSCRDLVAAYRAVGIRAEGDYRDNYSPGWKFNHWELKGVPIRVELGPKDIAGGTVVAVRRLTGDKRTLRRADSPQDLLRLLDTTHDEMLARARAERDARVSSAAEWAELLAALERRHLIHAPFCGDVACEDNIKADSTRSDDDASGLTAGAKSLCIPFEPPRALTAEDVCIHPACKNKPKFITLFGRSY